jgi:hypothetical protein
MKRSVFLVAFGFVVIGLASGCGLATGGPAETDLDESTEEPASSDRTQRAATSGSERRGTLLRAERPTGPSQGDNPRSCWDGVAGPVPDPWQPPDSSGGSRP